MTIFLHHTLCDIHLLRLNEKLKPYKNMIFKLNLLAVLLPVHLWANTQTVSNDTLSIQRNEKGKIEFARFQVNESSDTNNFIV